MPPRILIADPDEGFGQMLKQMLEMNGAYVAEHVATGALTLANLATRSPDLVIIDLAVSDIPYHILVKAVQQIVPKARVMLIPVNDELPTEAQTLTIHGIIKKPFFIVELGEQVAQALGTETKTLVNLPPPPSSKADEPRRPRVRMATPSSRRAQPVSAPALASVTIHETMEPVVIAEEEVSAEEERETSPASSNELVFPSEPALSQEAIASAIATSATPSVLVVDSDEAFGQMMKMMLEMNNAYSGSYVTTGTSALSVVQQHAPDLVIIDLSLPDISGPDLVTQIHQCAPHTRIMLIPLGEELPPELYELPIQGILTKPVFIGDLGVKIAKVLGTAMKPLVDLPPPPSSKSDEARRPRVRMATPTARRGTTMLTPPAPMPPLALEEERDMPAPSVAAPLKATPPLPPPAPVVTPPPAPAPITAVAPAAAPAPPSLAAVPRILVVDPDEAFGQMMKMMLEMNGAYAGEAVTSGAAAVTFVQQQQPALVIIDLNVSDIAIPQLITQLRQLAPTLRLMLIPLGDELPPELQALPIQGVLTKPVFIGDLGELIANALGAEVKQLVELPPPPSAKADEPRRPRVRMARRADTTPSTAALPTTAPPSARPVPQTGLLRPPPTLAREAEPEPAGEPAREELAPRPAEVIPPAPAAKGVPHILVVDPDEAFGQMMKMMLEMNGDYAASFVTNGKSALKFSPQDPPELVIVDLNIKDLAISALVYEVRRRMPRTHIMLVPIGAELPPDMRSLPIDGILTKPVFIGDLGEIIAKVLGTAIKPLVELPPSIFPEEQPTTLAAKEEPLAPPPAVEAKPSAPEPPAPPPPVEPPPSPVPRARATPPPSRLPDRPQTIEQVLNNLSSELRAEAVFLLRKGDLIAQLSNIQTHRTDTFIGLIARWLKIADELADFVNEAYGHFNQLHFEGERYHLYAFDLSDGIVLGVMTRSSVSPGTIRLNARDAGAHLTRLLK
jgi:DNA-binding NtrC family response regulator/predicted regulator of Ras-like GTPase activity (Roadblock/LC7/MglB family)